MTLPQFRVLAIVASSPERASRVAARAAVSRPSLSGVLDGLESRGWVRRSVVDGDRRGVHLDVTAAGNQALTDAAGRGPLRWRPRRRSHRERQVGGFAGCGRISWHTGAT